MSNAELQFLINAAIAFWFLVAIGLTYLVLKDREKKEKKPTPLVDMFWDIERLKERIRELENGENKNG